MLSKFRQRIVSSVISVSLLLAQSVAMADISSSSTSLNDMMTSSPITFNWLDSAKYSEEINRIHAAEKRVDFSFNNPLNFEDFDALIDANAATASFKYSGQFKYWWIQHWQGEVTRFAASPGMNWQLLFINSYADFTGGLAIQQHKPEIAGSWLEENLSRPTMKYISEHSFKVMVGLWTAGFLSALPLVFANNLTQFFAAPTLDAIKASVLQPNQGFQRQLGSYIRSKVFSDPKNSKFVAQVDALTGEMIQALEPLFNEDPNQPLTEEEVKEVWKNYGKPAGQLDELLSRPPPWYVKKRESFINLTVHDPIQLEMTVTQLMTAASRFRNDAETAIDQIVSLPGNPERTRDIRNVGNRLRATIVAQMRAESSGAASPDYQQTINIYLRQLKDFGADEAQLRQIMNGYEAEYTTTESAAAKFSGKLIYQTNSADISKQMDFAYRTLEGKSSLNYFRSKLASNVWDTINQIRSKAMLPVADLAMFKRSMYYPSVKKTRYDEMKASFSKGPVNRNTNANDNSVSRPRPDKPPLAEDVRARAAEVGEKR